MNRSPKRLRRVAIISETAVAPRRRFLAGVARFMKEHEPWAIYLKPWSVEKSLSEWVRAWKGDGIISAAWGPEASDVESIGIPMVDMFGEFPHLGIPLVHANDRAVGRLGAEHLLERKFQNYGFVQYSAEWSRQRHAGFEETLKRAGFTSHVHQIDFPTPGFGGPRKWERQQQAIAEWILSLPKPAGVMTSTDALGQQILESCQRANVVVPEEVAVIGADNDELICEICCPPLSSVIIDDFQRGYRTAQVLSDLMDGKRGPKKPIYIDPPGICCRASTDILAVEDEYVANALRYIREHGFDAIGIDEVARATSISRSVLERRFRKVLNRSINDEIVRVRLNRAVELLTETPLELKVIAAKAGFNSTSYMGSVFRDKLGRTPGSYRSS